MNQVLPIRFRIAALWILVAVPALSGTIPILDMLPADTRAGIEEHHHPGTHGFAHNHLICIQQESNQWAPAPHVPNPAVVPLSAGQRILPASIRPAWKRALLSPRPRSPPAA